MRFRLFLGSFGLIALLAPVVLTACSASGAGTGAPDQTAAETTLPTPLPEAGTGTKDSGADAGDSAPPKKKNDCKLPELMGTADVTPTFVTNAPPGMAPPTMTGGTLSGSYTVDKVTVFMPVGSETIADPKKSTGTVNAWAIFDGANYRIRLKAAFTISTAFGPQSQGADTASQGGFTATGPALALDQACDTSTANVASYSFTESGAGRATILIKTPSSFGDTYMQLDAAKN
jgi:hypothetical protein